MKITHIIDTMVFVIYVETITDPPPMQWDAQTRVCDMKVEGAGKTRKTAVV